MSQVEKKRKFIRAWYRNECAKLSFGDRLRLAKIWIDICLKDEEYEMAAALQEARKEIIKKHIKEKRANRKVSQKIIIALYLFKRRVKAWIKNKLSR